MKLSAKALLLVFCGFLCKESTAVQINQSGLGEVLIYPYYTVNNNLNTLYSVVNTTDQPKAIKVRFLEGEIAYDVLTFNIYLSPYDVWTGVLIPVESTIPGHFSEPSVLHLTADESCAPFLVKFGQEFLPFQIDLDGSNDNLMRAREGHLEMIEMGVLTGDAAGAVNHGNVGVPANCALIQTEWEDGEWDLEELEEASGGLVGSASLINVAEGIAFSYDAIALQNFWQQAGLHTEPSSALPDLSSAFPESSVLLANGELAVSAWSTGFEAVSAVLMNTNVYNEYGLDTIVNGRSEWMTTFPTKKYHTIQGSPVTPPFSQAWNGQASCDTFRIEIWDREEQDVRPYTCGNGACPPRPTLPEICYSSNVFEFLLPGVAATESTLILGSNNNLSFSTPSLAFTENGWARLDFKEDQQRMEPLAGTSFNGLPVTGFVVQQYSNAGAAEGLLAQYGSLFMHKGSVVTD